MKQNFCLLVLLLALIANKAVSQVTTIVNYDFNSVSSYPVQPTATASNITCSGNSSEAFQTYTGAATGSSAFTQNSTSGNALAMVNSGGTNTRYFLFQLGGSDLNSYSAYSVYLQPQRSSTGATTITVAYSTNGSSYTNLPTTYTVGTSFSETLIDLSSITALNYANAVYIKLMVSGASQTTGTIRIDNFEVQASKGFANGNPWQVNGYDVSFQGKLGIGMTNPLLPLEVTGNSSFHGNQTIGGNQDVTGSVIARQGLLFNSGKGIIESLATDGTQLYSYGKLNNQGGGNEVLATKCQKPSVYPNATTTHQLPGLVQIYPSDASGTYIPSGSVLNMQSWQNASSIDVAGGGSVGSSLLLDYFCGKDVVICGGDNSSASNGYGGTVRMGRNVQIGGPYPSDNYDIALNVRGIGKEGIKLGVPKAKKAFYITDVDNWWEESFLISGTGKTRVGYGNPATSANTAMFEVSDPSGSSLLIYGNSFGDIQSTSSMRPHFAPGTDFSVYEGVPNSNATRCMWIKDGKTHIGNDLPIASTTHDNAMLTVGGNGKIACKELYVIKPTNWADYVFEKNYQLMTLNEVEKYYVTNKHLPGVPSDKELSESGINSGEMDATLLKKIEELTLYIVELRKEVEKLKEDKK